MEAECNAVAMGRKRKEEIMQPILAKMCECFERVNTEARKLDEAVARHFTKIGSNDANANVLNANFSICGGCNGRTSLRELAGGGQQGQGQRRNNNGRSKIKLVYCSTCTIGMRLPKGIPSPSTNPQHNNQPLICPICNHQVIKMNQGDGYNGNGYQLCPKCFSDAPAEYGGAATSGEFRCFNCTHPTCSIATGTRGGDFEIFPCPFCAASGSSDKICLQKNSRGYTLSCSNYATTNRARCEYTIWLPREANSVSISETNNRGPPREGSQPVTCNRCSNANKVVRKLLFRWKPNSIPPGVPRELSTCVLCDTNFRYDFNVSIPQFNQVRIRGRSNTAGAARGNTGRGRGSGRQSNSNFQRQRAFNNQAGNTG